MICFGRLSLHIFSKPPSLNDDIMAYGAISAPVLTKELPVLSYNLPAQKTLTTFPLTLQTTPLELRQTMSDIFAREIQSP